MAIKQRLREQFDFINDIELIMFEHDNGSFTLAKHHTVTDKWEYCDTPIEGLKAAWECFDKIMCSAPINDQIPIL